LNVQKLWLKTLLHGSRGMRSIRFRLNISKRRLRRRVLIFSGIETADGRSFPKDLESTWQGYSIGKWEGATLVIDTAGLNDKAWLVAQRLGITHTLLQSHMDV
jgi:hypothetical protein